MKMIAFPHEMQCDEAIRCVFDLNKLDINVYKELKKIGESRADELALFLNKERSTMYRSLEKLTGAGICKKVRRTLTQGGYYYVYQCNDMTDVQKRAQICLDAWYESVKQTLKLLSD